MQSVDRQAFYTLVKAGLRNDVQPLPVGYHWEQVVELASRQGMVGIAFDGLVAVIDKFGGESIPVEFKLKLYGLVHLHTSKTKRLWDICADFAMKMKPLRCYVLKGIDYAKYWPKPLYREFGDMDIVVANEYNEIVFEDANRKAESIGAQVEWGTYKHSHIHYDGVMVENHQFITNFEGTKHGMEMERELRKLMFQSAPSKLLHTDMLSPSVNFTAIFLLKHAQHHFVFEGVAIRHFIDWIYFIEKEGKNIDWKWFYETLDAMNLRNFTDMLCAFCERKLAWNFNDEHIISNATDEVLDEVEEYMFTPKANVQNRNPFYIVKRFYKRFQRAWKFRDLHYQSFLQAIWTSIAYAGIFDRKPKLD